MLPLSASVLAHAYIVDTFSFLLPKKRSNKLGFKP